MRILHIVPSLGPSSGGTSTSVLGLVQAQITLGADVHLLSGRRDGEPAILGGNLAIQQGKHLPLPFAIPGPGLWTTMARAIAAADLVHLHTIWNGTITAGGWLCRHHQKPMLLTPHGMLDRHNMQRRARFKRLYLRALEQGNLHAMSAFHFLDETEREGCSWLMPARRAPCVILPNGLDVQALVQRLSRVPPGLVRASVPDPKAVHLVFLGRLNAIKGLALQLEVLADLRAAGVPAHLHLIGPDDGEGALLDAQAATSGLSAFVHRRGPIFGDERLRWLQEADAVLLTSHYECNSMSAAETLAVGGLLVATDTCHLDKAARAGAACVVPRLRVVFRHALGDLLAQSSLANDMRAAGQAFARQHLDWSPLARSMLAFYGGLV